MNIDGGIHIGKMPAAANQKINHFSNTRHPDPRCIDDSRGENAPMTGIDPRNATCGIQQNTGDHCASSHLINRMSRRRIPSSFDAQTKKAYGITIIDVNLPYAGYIKNNLLIKRPVGSFGNQDNKIASGQSVIGFKGNGTGDSLEFLGFFQGL